MTEDSAIANASSQSQSEDSDQKSQETLHQDFTELNQPGHNWSKSNIEDCLFIGAILHDSNFTDSTIAKCNFYRADLSNSQFIGAEIENCQMIGARLRNSEFRNASLVAVNFRGACLCGVKFVGDVEFTDAELHNVHLEDICYNDDTVWPVGIEPPASRTAGCHCDEQDSRHPSNPPPSKKTAKSRRNINAN